MSSPLLLVLLLCLSCAAQVRSQDDANKLRLCGRALLRAVVYTCGGSRWRRVMEGEDFLPEGDRMPNFLETTDVPAMIRRGRDQSQALLNVCCQQGCRKSELSMLC